jgi:hypothetical protein
MSFPGAPAQLPIAPRPVHSELFSSWIMRVAAGNCLSLSELLNAIEPNYPEVLSLQSLDFSLPPSFLRALARFCRVPFRSLQDLDLQRKLSHLETALLLRFPGDDPSSPRRKHQRVGYAFCPLCVANQDVIHASWEWCFACLPRCSVHRIPLQDTCPLCGESDPLNFYSLDLIPNPTCWACGASLVDPTENSPQVRKYDPVIRAIEDAYRAALLGIAPHPSLVGTTTDCAFRRFVDDVLQLLICFPQSGSAPRNRKENGTALRSRQTSFAMISELIANTAPGSDPWERQSRYHRSLKFWADLFTLPTFSESDAISLEHASMYWPLVLQKRFAAALLIRNRRRWPDGRSMPTTVCPRFTYNEAFAVRDLRAGKLPRN